MDNIERVEKKRVSFDADLTPPVTQGVPATEWVSINVKGCDASTVSQQDISVICCTRDDKNFEKLAVLRDIVAGYLSNRHSIPLYKASDWSVVGHMVVCRMGYESGPERAKDGTKFWIIPITLKWGSKV